MSTSYFTTTVNISTSFTTAYRRNQAIISVLTVHFQLVEMALTDSVGKIVFMTTKERELFPANAGNDKFCNTLCPVKGADHIAPGHYDYEKKGSINYDLESKVVSTKGYTLGARTAPRFTQERILKTPCPTEYQRHTTSNMVETSKKPFLIGQDRFPMFKRNLNVTPGAGTYEHEIHLNRKVQWHQSFGGSPVFLPAVSLRSTIDRNTEKLYSTKEEKKYQRKLAYLKLYY